MPKKFPHFPLKAFKKNRKIKQELVANQPDAENLPVTDFSEEEMQAAWKEYTTNVESDGKYNLLSHLTMGVPKLTAPSFILNFQTKP